ncbi:hypothetical protein CJD36_008080 [Flavipsychrobacter stenotrophus]|uniref:DUF6089 domain-containing protein n=1 Tax=Flavipsychrobacter stenotrophus TaxID=2077091 RepID=A0A2S7SYF2_9BACT|nr:DUF6089 family protein [Flavipsychrobacter stenotrophus]PQJ11744.1 hypothetical protein CJD36_008080 [Flavipsychrobacter stenotrophus]
MRKLLVPVILITFLLAGKSSFAQSYFTANEYGISFGGSQYFGDLNENYGFHTINMAYGLYGRRRMNSYIALKLSANYTQVGYDDKYNTIPYKVSRNLNFKSKVIEATFQAEFNFFRFVTGDKSFRFTPYLTGGIGAFYYNPYTTYNGYTYDLRPLGTEGQNTGLYDSRKYNSIGVCFPIGAGIKYWIAPGVNFTFEIADRLTATDYLDDVSQTYVGVDKFPRSTALNPAKSLQDRSIEIAGNPELGRTGKQRGNSSSRDQYLMAVISLSFNFTTYKCPAFMGRDLIKTY